MNTFTRSVDLLQRAMDVSSLRYQVTSNNLANSDVPNFKRSNVNFESMLKTALESEASSKNSFQMQTTDERHIKSDQYIDYKTVKPRKVVDYLSTIKANGNNVDPEVEAMNVLKTQLNYQLLTQLQNFNFSQLRTVLR
ncbi:MAG: flagellar basal body rod protein FlgB [Treponemataceae bacterium]